MNLIHTYKNKLSFAFRSILVLWLVITPMHLCAQLPDGKYLYAVKSDAAEVAIFDMNNGFSLVKKFSTVSGMGNVDGVFASSVTGKFYIVGQKNSGEGTMVSVDLYTEKVLWEKAYKPGADRGSLSQDGKTIFLPTNEYVTTGEKFINLVDAMTGNVIKTLDINSAKSHDLVIGASGFFAYQETKSSNLVSVINTGKDGKPISVLRTIDFNGICAPLVPDGRDQYLLVNTAGVHGFQVGDINTGKVVATASITGKPGLDVNEKVQRYNHGVAWRPDEKEAWVLEGTSAYVFDMTNPLNPKQTHEIPLKYTSRSAHWIAFSIDGKYAYACAYGPTEVWDANTKAFIGYLGAIKWDSEYLVEIHYKGGVATQVGDQYGIGRVTNSTGISSFLSPGEGVTRMGSLRIRNGKFEFSFNASQENSTYFDMIGKQSH